MPAVILILFLVTAAVAASGWTIANQMVDVVSELPRYRQNIRNKVDALHMPTSGALAQAAQSLREIGDELSQQPPVDARPVPVNVVAQDRSQLAYLWNLAEPFLEPIGETGIVLIFAIFILIEKEDLRDRLLRLAGIGHLNVMTEAIDDAAKRVSRYLLMQLLVNACFGLFTGLGLYLIGLPNALLWGVIAGILRIIPYAGTLVALALPFALSLAVFDGWMHPALVFLLFAGTELITGNFVEPFLYGVHTGISSLALLVTTVFWAALWGPAGLIMSTPLTVCLVVLGRYVPQLAVLNILLGDEPVLTPAAQLYQRLLAMDHQEAQQVVNGFMKSSTLGQLYDVVLVPALTLAEQDRHRGAIDSAREEFLFLNMNEMVAEFSEQKSEAPARQINFRVLCVPAHDQADEIAAAMLAQLLDHEGFVALSFPHGDNLTEMLQLMQPGENDLICISALQPYAFAPTRAACKSIRAQFPRVMLGAGIWGFAGDTKKAMARFDRHPPDCFFTSFEQVVEQCRGKASSTRSFPEAPVPVGGHSAA